MTQFVWFLVYTAVVFCRDFDTENVDKRILLNDPDLFHTQIQAIQRELETVKSQVATQVNINNAQQAEIDSLKRVTNNQHTTQGNIVIQVIKVCLLKTATKQYNLTIRKKNHGHQSQIECEKGMN